MGRTGVERFTHVERSEIWLKTKRSGRPSTFRTGGNFFFLEGGELASQQRPTKCRFGYRCQVRPPVSNMSANANRLEHVADIHGVYCSVSHRQTASGVKFLALVPHPWQLLISSCIQ